MSIKGLTDRAAAFPSVGILRKGEKKVKENAPGKDLTFFRFVTDDGLAEKMFIEAYPNEDALRNINVFLPHKTTDENMDSWIEKWLASSLVYRSDGETVVLWKSPKGGFSTEAKPDPRPEIGADGKRADGSLQVGRLSVIVPELGRFATVTVLTTSKHDIINLTRQLRSYEALLGDLRGIPFVIRRRLTTISTPAENGKRARREKWLLSIETQAQWSIAKLGMMEREALATGNMVIEAGTTDDYLLKELPEGMYSPFEDEVPEPVIQGEPEKTFTSIDDLLYQFGLDFGLSETEGKAELKACGYTGFSPAKSGEMYKAVQARHKAVPLGEASKQADALAA